MDYLYTTTVFYVCLVQTLHYRTILAILAVRITCGLVLPRGRTAVFCITMPRERRASI